MKVSVIGLGYIGLPTAAVLSSNGVSVVGVDVEQETVDTVNKGKVHIVEPGLEEMVCASVKSGKLRAVMQPEEADVFMIAVPTPFKEGKKPDLSYVKASVVSIATVLKKGDLIILESTSPVGTTEKIVKWIKDIRKDLSLPEFNKNEGSSCISVAHCPERVLPGRIIDELVYNDRIIGGVTEECAKKAKTLYKTFVQAECIITDCRTAELSKLTENSFRDVNIAFANELSLICDKLDISVWELIRLSNRHPRVDILQPGPGVGGHCIAVDPWFIVDSNPDESKLIHTARLVNESKPLFVLEKVRDSILLTGKKPSDLKVACLGLAFKPDIDDLRESPALEISQKINLMGFMQQYLVDPYVDDVPSGFDHASVIMSELEFALCNSDIVVLLVDHAVFKSVNLDLLSGKKVVDTRGVFS